MNDFADALMKIIKLADDTNAIKKSDQLIIDEENKDLVIIEIQDFTE